MATTYDLVRRFFPESTDEECEFLLWETTAFPMASVLTIARQLKSNKKAVDNKMSACFRCGTHFDNEGMIGFYDICPKCESL